jgi:Flp pilus assembly protein TadG
MSKRPINSHPRGNCSGQALIEFALVIPLLFLLIVLVVNVGSMMYAWITVSNAARAGAQFWMFGSASVKAPAQPTSAEVTALITRDLQSLPNSASLVVTVCKNLNSTVTCSAALPAGLSNPPSDPESATTFCLKSVDVNYTYQPFIRTWTFAGLGISIPAALGGSDKTMHYRALMRSAGGC